MSTKTNDDMVPRPLPKPSKVEVIPVRPEVPEVSLIFDQFPINSQKNSKEYPPDSRMRTITSNYPFDQRYEDLLKRNRVPEPLNADDALCFSPSIQGQNATRHIQKKVSFSPHQDNHDYLRPSPLVHNVNDCNKYTYRRNSSNCRCNNYETNNLSNDLKYTSEYPDFPSNTPRFSYISERFAENEVYSKKPCACAHCVDDLKHGSCTQRPEEQKFVSAEELQNLALKFENMFLNLNYKLSQISENFVPRDEFNSLRQKYKDRLKCMQENIDKLEQKSKEINRLEYNCKNCNEKATTQRSDNDALTLRYARPNNVSELNTGSRNHNIRDTRHEDASAREYTPDFMKECAGMPVNSEIRHEVAQNQYMKPVIFEDTSSFPVQTHNAERPKENGASTELVANDQNRNHQHKPDIRNTNVSKGYQTAQRSVEASVNTITSLTLPDAQLKRMYHDIVLQVKDMIERERLHQIDETGDPVHLIKKATIEQFRKMGINVENMNTEEKYFSQANENTAQHKVVNVMNSAPSSDLSIHMNALAMKYITDHQSENEFQRKKSPANDVSMSCNNISIATLQYLERYQLLPTSDKAVAHNKCERNVTDQRDKFYDQCQGNDRSFIH